MACKDGGEVGMRRRGNFKGISLKLLIKVQGFLRPLKLGVLQQVSIWEPRGAGGGGGVGERLGVRLAQIY